MSGVSIVLQQVLKRVVFWWDAGFKKQNTRDHMHPSDADTSIGPQLCGAPTKMLVGDSTCHGEMPLKIFHGVEKLMGNHTHLHDASCPPRFSQILPACHMFFIWFIASAKAGPSMRGSSVRGSNRKPWLVSCTHMTSRTDRWCRGCELLNFQAEDASVFYHSKHQAWERIWLLVESSGEEADEITSCRCSWTWE